MPVRPSLTLLAALLMLLSACHKPSTELPRDARAEGTFDVAEAMKMFYGNYDAKSQTSIARLPQYNGVASGAGDVEMSVKPIFNSYGADSGRQSFVVVTSAVPRDYDCHACAPAIGMAVFSQTGGKWTMDASNRAVTHLGSWGKPPSDIQLVQIGPTRYAVEITGADGGQGQTTTVLQILIPWKSTVSLGLDRIIADNDLGGCDPQGLPCYENHREVKFTRGNDLEYFNLELELTGTDLTGIDSASPQARKVSGLETLKLENGRYVQVSRQGDLTTEDRAVAEREGLK